MRVLVIHAHPVAESYNGGLHRIIVEELTAKGHEVDDCDLHAEGFDPVMSRAERLAYHDTETNTAPVSEHVARLRAAQALVLSFPVWNFGYPAILKGYFDRVFLPGVSFKLVDGAIWPDLHNIAKVAVVTSYGSSRLRAMIFGDPPRNVVNRGLRAVIRPGAPVKYLAHYDMNNSTPQTRARFIERTRTAMRAF